MLWKAQTQLSYASGWHNLCPCSFHSATAAARHALELTANIPQCTSARIAPLEEGDSDFQPGEEREGES